MGLPPRRRGERASLRLAANNSRRESESFENSCFMYSSDESSHEEEEELIVIKGKTSTKRLASAGDTAPPPANESATTAKKSKMNDDEGGKVEQSVSSPPPIRHDVGDLLNCKICLNGPASPIHCCPNGHIICGICVDDAANKCGICQADLQLSNFAEFLSRQFDLKLVCGNQKSGCAEAIPAAEMKNHLQNCYYRDIICTEMKTGSCEKTKMTMSEYANHLYERHQCLSGSPRRCVLTLEDENMLRGTSSEPRCRSWPAGILKKGGNTFIMLSEIHTDASIYIWMTVLGSAETAEKLTFRFKLYKTMENGKKISASWTMPVFAYHERPKFVEGLPCYLNISGKMLLEFCTRVELQDVPKLQFDSSYRIF